MTPPRATAIAALSVLLCASIARPARADASDAGTKTSADDPTAEEDLELALLLPELKPSKGSISEELGMLQPTQTANPVGALWGNTLIGIINLDKKWSLDLEFLYTVQEGSPPPPGSNFGDSGGHVSLFSAGADWDSGRHWSFNFLGELSPKSSTTTETDLTTQLSATGANTLTDAKLAVTSSNVDLQAGGAYDTAGASNLEWTFRGSLTAGHLDSDQHVSEVEDRAGNRPISTSALATYCANHPRICGKALDAAVQDRDYPLDSLKLEGGVTSHLAASTDLGLTGDYFLYRQDPSEVGYFNVATAGRSLSGGAGVPVAPLRFNARIDLIHRFGDLSVKLWGSAGQYADDGSPTYAAGAKVQLKLGHAWRIWISGLLQHDETDVGDEWLTCGAYLGGAYRF